MKKLSIGHETPVQFRWMRSFTEEHIHGLKELLDRGLNTWDDAPAWLMDLSDRVSNEIELRKRLREEFGDAFK